MEKVEELRNENNGELITDAKAKAKLYLKYELLQRDLEEERKGFNWNMVTILKIEIIIGLTTMLAIYWIAGHVMERN